MSALVRCQLMLFLLVVLICIQLSPVSGQTQRHTSSPTSASTLRSTYVPYTQISQGIDCPGSDISNTTTTSAEACAILCSGVSTCKGFATDIPVATCILKTAVNLGTVSSSMRQCFLLGTLVRSVATPKPTPIATPKPTVPAPQQQIFSCIQQRVTFTVPSNVFTLTITAAGAQGGGTGGSGAVITGTFSVNPSDVLSILVGCQPTGNGYPAGGGGSFVAKGSNYQTATAMIVAGGGGGGYANFWGQGGQAGTSGGGPVPGNNGNGAFQTTCGGGGGGFSMSGFADKSGLSKGGDSFHGSGQGGTFSGPSLFGYQIGGFGGGAPASASGQCNMHAGAGGGYSGGSGINSYTSQNFGYGGGSYNSGSPQTNTANSHIGNGQVIIAWTPGVKSKSVAVHTGKIRTSVQYALLFFSCGFTGLSTIFFMF